MACIPPRGKLWRIQQQSTRAPIVVVVECLCGNVDADQLIPSLNCMLFVILLDLRFGPASAAVAAAAAVELACETTRGWSEDCRVCRCNPDTQTPPKSPTTDERCSR